MLLIYTYIQAKYKHTYIHMDYFLCIHLCIDLYIHTYIHTTGAEVVSRTVDYGFADFSTSQALTEMATSPLYGKLFQHKLYVCMYCMHVRLYVCTFVCMYVCMYVCVNVVLNISTHKIL